MAESIKEHGIKNIPGTQFFPYFLAKLKKKGVWHCLLRLFQELSFKIISNTLGIFSYPICLMTKTRFVPFYTRSIGHLCVEPDCYIKEEILGMRPKYNSIVLAPRGEVANQHLLDYWKTYNIKVISSPGLCWFFQPLAKNRFSAYNLNKYVFDYSPLFPEIRKRYLGRLALLKLTEYDRNRGLEALEGLGMPKNAWFVCVHCREDSYLGDVDQSNRNCDINSYFPAIKAITDRGGWAIRMGDPNMKKIPQMKNVIDYCHSKIRSDWMDVFLSASCKFFLGCNSGLSHLPTLFGVPSAVANCVPMSGLLSYGADGISIPKLVWSINDNRYLTFKEVFDSPVSNYRWDSSFVKSGVRIMDNSPEDIALLAMEILDRACGKASYAEEDETLQEQFKSLMKPGHYSYGAISRIGKDFLRKYKYLLPDHSGVLIA